MKNIRRQTSEINAGSMADIAFLLLLFFLVATTISVDKGIERQLPKPCPTGMDCGDKTKANNILYIAVNGKDQLFVDDKLITLEELKEVTKSFLDNNAAGNCDYCSGEKLANFSDNPKSAIVSLKNENETSYEFYIAVQDELTKAYFELRRNYAKTILGKSENELTERDLKILKDKYPFRLSEAE